MRVLVVGGGGREHALAWKLAASPAVTHVLVAPGNAGTAREPGVSNVAVAAEDVDGLLALAKERAVDLTIVGPEAPLVAGIVDRFTAAGLKCFGPEAAAAQLEGSKTFAKDFMARHHIPTARYATFEDMAEALAYLAEQPMPIVVKADGLAAGKGVVVAEERADAEAAVRSMLGDNAFGSAGARVVIEEFLPGEEASYIVMSDGETVRAMASSQDHKRVGERDTGPNTGGMGAYSPAPVVTDAVAKRIDEEVIRPVIEGMRADGIRYRGFLYAGLMVSPDGSIKVLEFNCRFGDPECQPVLSRLTSDLAEACLAATEDRLHEVELAWDSRPAVGVVVAAHGYPGTVRKGDAIEGLDDPSLGQVKVFEAGTRQEGERTVTAGGRVLCVTALGNDLAAACTEVYGAMEKIRFAGMFFRRDIAWRALEGAGDR